MIRSNIIFTFLGCLLLHSVAAAQSDDAREAVIRGVVKDGTTRKPIENAHIVAVQGNIGTVTNADGVFVLKIPAADRAGGVRISHIGYSEHRIPAARLSDLGEAAVVYLTPSATKLDAVTVLSGDARPIVEEALRKIPENYSDKENLFSAFYRETVQKRSRYIGVSEAVADVYKSDYSRRNIVRDRVQIRKGRRLISQRRTDTLAVKIVGGPTLPVVMDFVKNGDLLFEADELNDYEFKVVGSVDFEGRPQYIVSFRPYLLTDYSHLKGLLYIDRQSLSFTRAEFEVDLSDRDRATRAILQKRPAGLKFRPQQIAFVVTFRQQGGKSYLNYVRSTIRFRCNWAKRMFASNYASVAEMVMVDRHDTEVAISRKDAIGTRAIFSDMVEDYWDEDYWRDYNIIEPTESLEQAVHKLKKG